SPEGQKILFVVFMVIYIVTMAGNLLIVVTAAVSPSFDVSMHFFLGYFSFMDAVYSTIKAISFQACMAQLFIRHLFGGAEILLLIVMIMTVQLPFVYNLLFFGPNVIDHFICHMYLLLKLVFRDTYIIGLTVVANDRAICVVIFMLLISVRKKVQSFVNLWILHHCGSLHLCSLYFY
ncbi:hypothetical protein U0070_021070, partial [Myodes glareolus]